MRAVLAATADGARAKSRSHTPSNALRIREGREGTPHTEHVIWKIVRPPD